MPVTPFRGALALAMMLLAPTLPAAALPAVEPMPTLDAATLVPAELLNGAGYTVDEKAPIEGYMAQFTLRAPAGTFRADGTEMLAIRVNELSAIAQLAQLSQTGVFADALAASAVKTGSAIGQAVMNPVATLEGLPAGVGRFFESASSRLARATESAASGSPQQAGDAAMDLLGVNQARRRLARQVGADPYTTNPVLARQLDDLSRAAFAGGISLDVALAVSTAGVATAISTTATVSNLVWDKPPADVQAINEGKLAGMGVGASAIRGFVTNPWFTPTLSVPLVDLLQQMPGARGRESVVALAGTVASESEARFVLNAVRMARAVAAEGDPVVALELSGRILVVRTRSGRTLVPAPVDYVVWTDRVMAFAEQRRQGGRREIRTTGWASDRSREGLQATGWSVREHVPR